jgi:hypothetical protein
MTGQKIEREERPKPDFPDELAHIYGMYKRVRFGRCDKGEKILLVPREPLQYSEVDAFMRLTDTEAKPDEVELIMNIDAIFNDAQMGARHG